MLQENYEERIEKVEFEFSGNTDKLMEFFVEIMKESINIDPNEV